MTRSALLLGASGLVGNECLKILLENDSYEEIHALVRKPLVLDHPKLVQHRINFEELPEEGRYWASVAVFCCLGTTIKKAGSQAAFRRVDHDYPLAVARRAASHGAAAFVLVSAVGANASSSIFYNRIKGETERDLESLTLNRLVILRPSLILGERVESRPGEKFASALMTPLAGLMVGPLRRYRPIQARTIARAMVRASLSAKPGTTILESEHIQEFGKE